MCFRCPPEASRPKGPSRDTKYDMFSYGYIVQQALKHVWGIDNSEPVKTVNGERWFLDHDIRLHTYGSKSKPLPAEER